MNFIFCLIIVLLAILIARDLRKLKQVNLKIRERVRRKNGWFSKNFMETDPVIYFAEYIVKIFFPIWLVLMVVLCVFY